MRRINKHAEQEQIRRAREDYSRRGVILAINKSGLFQRRQEGLQQRLERFAHKFEALLPEEIRCLIEYRQYEKNLSLASQDFALLSALKKVLSLDAHPFFCDDSKRYVIRLCRFFDTNEAISELETMDGFAEALMEAYREDGVVYHRSQLNN